MRIVVLAGGLSSERDVSLVSGSLIANALMEKGHKVLLLDVYDGIEIGDTGFESLFYDINSGKKYTHSIPTEEPNLNDIKANSQNGNMLIGKNVLEVCQYADVVFMALHGGIGEDGKLQGTFDILGIKYTGTGHVGSLLAMDKDLTKRLLIQSNIATAPWIVVNDSITDKELQNIELPCVIKPCNNGSSIGVYMAYSYPEIRAALENVKKYEDLIIIEKMIKGREFSVGVIEDQPLPVIEIIPNQGFYDYTNKYQSGCTTEICPANLSSEQTNKVQQLALKVHQTLRLGDYSRIDFILDENNEFICLEANTLPGMTPTSLIPQEALSLGINYPELCEQIAMLPLKQCKR